MFHNPRELAMTVRLHLVPGTGHAAAQRKDSAATSSWPKRPGLFGSVAGVAALAFMSAAPVHAGEPDQITAQPQDAAKAQAHGDPLANAQADAEQQLHQTFTNLRFEDFGPAPVEGPLYQATAGGKIIYFAPQSEHLLFATVYDRNGVNLTALAQEQGASRRLKAIDPAKALAIGPGDAPTVIEFTDPDCPYCQALDRYWNAKAAEGKPVRRLIFFVSGIHPTAAAKAEHILCSPDREAAFRAAYSGQTPPVLRQCAAGRDKVAADAELVARVGVSGTPTLIADGKLISGFQQAELEAFLDRHAKPAPTKAVTDAPR
ncbi:DsbC family protein [Sphingobium yanoikuyae]|uniref:Thiol:disulfide interchange protein n=2 Tax=Alphaproteobacteria TaxID=28211 RepID=A0AA43B5R2_SPHYA|nr:DsbC family protein [Sphingobium yanoikuyae]MDH2129526.1 DsbC family protein [Sphingobium yanoikuyae]MDH2167649.1 DsbC family protein [Sphingobium yanoikuyae]